MKETKPKPRPRLYCACGKAIKKGNMLDHYRKFHPNADLTNKEIR